MTLVRVCSIGSLQSFAQEMQVKIQKWIIYAICMCVEYCTPVFEHIFMWRWAKVYTLCFLLSTSTFSLETESLAEPGASPGSKPGWSSSSSNSQYLPLQNWNFQPVLPAFPVVYQGLQTGPMLHRKHSIYLQRPTI